MSREEFERWITSPPYEKSVVLNTSMWSGQYDDYQVQLAWEAWQAALTVDFDAPRDAAKGEG